MSQSSKRTYYRNRITKILEKQGCFVIPVNLGIVDLVAVSDTHVRIIRISNFKEDYMDCLLTEKLKEIKVPEFTLKEVWTKRGRGKDLYNVEIL